MKPALVVVLSVVLSAGAAFAVLRLCGPAKATADADAAARVESLARALDDVSRRLALHEKAPDVASPATASPAAPRVSDDEIVDRVLARLSAKGVSADGAALSDAHGRGAAADASGKKLDVNAEVAKLLTDIPFEAREEIWKALREAGQMDAAIAAIEQKSKADPSNANLRFLLGAAYLEKCNTGISDAEKGTWAVKADKTFDAALAIDDHNWPARFTKAVALSFYPPVLNKQPEAIKNFETLISQQEQSGQAKPEFAQTFVFLSGLYGSQGKSEQALATVQKGLAMFPDDASLKNALAQLSGK